jgi:hypothetical protein
MKTSSSKNIFADVLLESEWFMGVCDKFLHSLSHSDLTQIAALTGYENANSTALGLWEALYPDTLLLALTDTFSTKAFFTVCIWLSFAQILLIAVSGVHSDTFTCSEVEGPPP